jgi:LDH2 family malate/lactate/ureidoglycolate dehydrogenase
MKVERMKDGIPLTEDTWASISAAARHVGLSEAHVAKAGAAH